MTIERNRMSRAFQLQERGVPSLNESGMHRIHQNPQEEGRAWGVRTFPLSIIM